ncbi:MAG: BMP family ABC transporter substrate-binding protein [Chloroflexota bacterium]
MLTRDQRRPRNLRRRTASLVSVLGVCVAILAGCSAAPAAPSAAPASPAPAASPAASPSATASASGQVCADKKVALVTTQRTGDQGVVDDMVSNGADKAKTELGAQTTVIEALDSAAYVAQLTNLANAGFNVIATNFNPMTDPLKQVAPKFPNVHFIQIYGDPLTPTIPNLRTVSYRYDEATYLSGILAATITKTGILAFEAGLFGPAINTDYWAFRQGAMSVNPNITILAAAVGSFTDEAKAKEVVSALFAQGADVVQQDGPIVGLIQAALDKQKYAIIGSETLSTMAPEWVVGVTFIRFGESLFHEIAAACQDSFQGGHSRSGVKDGITGLYVPDTFLQSGDPSVLEKVKAVLPAIEEAQADIASGSLVIAVNQEQPQ